jgi:hypothetical protein
MAGDAVMLGGEGVGAEDYPRLVKILKCAICGHRGVHSYPAELRLEFLECLCGERGGLYVLGEATRES